MASALTSRSLFRYALLGLPLGCVGLPLYVHLPKYYADTLPISLALLGTLLFVTRILDCLADPLIGYVSDRYPSSRKRMMAGAMPLLAMGVLALFYLPQFATADSAAWWLALLMAVTYLSYSVLTINFYASGLQLTENYHETTRVSTWREGAVIVGVLVASALPQVFMQSMPETEAYHQFGWIFTVILAVCGLLFLRRKQAISPVVTQPNGSWRTMLAQRELRWIFGVFFLNAIPTSITATLFLFFVSDILHAPALSGPFLLAYFVAAMIAMPVWNRISRRIGKKRALMVGMLLAILSFTGAYSVEAGAVVAFGIICIFSGVALGADLAFLPAILADAVGKSPAKGGIEFGVWNFISKFTLALAAGIALPVLAWLGYQPGSTTAADASMEALRISYAVLPCLFKLLALTLLWLSPIDQRKEPA